MAEYIEREKVCELCGAKDIDGCSDECLIFMGNVPVADVAPVVRCKDCKHVHVAPIGFRWCKVWERIQTVGDDGFCNFGERKGGDG